MSEAFILRRFDLPPGFTCQSGVKRDLRQQESTLRVRRVGCNKTLCRPGTRQLVRFRRQGKRRKVRMWRPLPSIRDTILSMLFMTGRP
jgi:hypothetical protein